MNDIAGQVLPCNALSIIAALVAGMASLLNPVSRAEDDGRSQQPEIAAIVNGEPVFVAEVKRELHRVIKDRPIEPETRRVLQAKTLDQLIARQLIVQWLEKTGQAAGTAEVDREVTRLKKQLGRREISVQQYLEKRDMTERAWRRLLAWQIGWQRFLDRYLTDQNLEQYFLRNRRDFDGTRMRVAHILLPVDEEHGRDIETVVAEAGKLAEQIDSQGVTFAEAARNHSAAPTAAEGGEIGFIGRRAPMPESFSRAAFELEEGEVSKPVVTVFGVHLIRCLETEPGQNRWRDVREELVRAVTKYLFTWAANRQRPNAEIEFTGALPHLEANTARLSD